MSTHGGAIVDAALPPRQATTHPLLPEIAGPSLVDACRPRALARARSRLRRARQPPFRHTKAIVVVKDGRVVAERYAPGYGIDTPILGFSATKSVISALTAILVRQGKLAVDEPAPVAAWQGADDPRRAITIDHLLAPHRGLAIGSSL